MIVSIQSVSQEFTKNGAEFYKVSGVNDKGGEVHKLVFDNLKEKWPLLKENATLDFKLEKRGQFWNVVDINEVGSQLPPAQPTGSVTEIGGHKPPEPIPPIVSKVELSRSQEIGEHVAFKSISDLIAKGIIKPEGATKPYWIWYWLKLSQLTGTKAEKKEGD